MSEVTPIHLTAAVPIGYTLHMACTQKPKAQLAATLPKLGEELGGEKDDSEVCNLPVPSVTIACLYCTKLFSGFLWQSGSR